MSASKQLKFCEIKKGGKIGKVIAAKVGNIHSSGISKSGGQPYSRTVLSQGNSKIVVVAFGNNVNKMKQFKLGDNAIFPAMTFKAIKRNIIYKSPATVPYDLEIISLPDLASQSRSSTQGVNEPSTSNSSQVIKIGKSVPETCKSGLIKAIQGVGVGESITLTHVQLSEGRIYRYWGCHKCNSAIPKPRKDGKYYCNGNYCKRTKKNSRAGVLTTRKTCMVLQGLYISDECGHNYTGVVVFNDECEGLLGKKAHDFVTDNEATEAVETIFCKSEFTIELQRKKKKRNSKFEGPLMVQRFIKTGEVSIVLNANENENNEEWKEDHGDEDKNEAPKGDIEFSSPKKYPRLGRLEVKINYTETSAKYYEPKHTYRVKSGLVLMINNKNFPTHPYEKMRVRNGSDVDVEYLSTIFKQCDYPIFKERCIEDVQNREELDEHLLQYKTQLVADNADIAIIVVMSHGSNCEISLAGPHGTNKSANLIEDIVLPFCDTKFPEFQGKPKVFIIEACQDFPVSEYSSTLKMIDGSISDVMICLPALPGFSARRSNRDGSLFIHFLTKTIMEYGYKTEFQDLMEMVQREMGRFLKKKMLKSISTSYHFGIMFSKLFLIPDNTTETTAESNGEDSESGMEIDD